MRIALTGATGFAGRAIVSALVEQGHTLRALVRDPSLANVSDKIEAVRGDLDSQDALDELQRDADVLVHIAGAISAKNRQDYFRINADGTRNIMDTASRSSVKRIVHISSMAAREPGLSNYAASKAAGECEALKLTGQKSVLVLRPSAIYGPEDQATLPLLQQLMHNISIIPGTPSARFALIHVSDFAQIVAGSVTSSRDGVVEVDDSNGPHNWDQLTGIVKQAFGSARKVIYLPRSAAMTAAAFAEMFARLTNKTSMISREKMRELYHPDWAVNGTGWPRNNPVPLERGLIDTINWYVNNGLIRI